MYDALTQLNSQGGVVEFWDIGFVNVWDKQANDYGTNFISKLFSALPDDVSVGNPTFAKNSPFIIAMDLIDNADDTYSILGANVETGDVGGVFSNSDINSPNYSVDDRQLIFNFKQNGASPILAVIDLEDDKINSVPNTAFVLIEGATGSGARLGTWFATGQRDLNTPTEAVFSPDGTLKVYPNPFGEQFRIEVETPQAGPLHLSLFDGFGRMVGQKTEAAGTGLQTFEWNVGNLPPGAYWLRIHQNGQQWGQRVLKF